MQYTGRRYIDETRNDLPDHSLSDIVHTDSGHYERYQTGYDQRIKLKVRDAVLKYMKAHMTRAERRDAKATKAWTLTHKKELTDTADKILKKEKVSYRAKAEVTTCYFPDKRYGDIIFPEGNYEALRIVLGKGNGHNWWCVLYPNLCFTNATCAVVDEDGKKELKEALSAEEYEMVTATSEFKIKWFFFGKDHAKESD